MNLTQLEYFCTVASLMSFSKAADQLYVSQSAISKSISALEKELHADLFIKQGRYLHLSKAGEILLEHAREILQFYEKKTEEIYQQLGLSDSRLTVGIPPTAGSMFFYKVVDQFKAEHPRTTLVIEEGTSKAVVERILQRTEDIGIVIEPFFHPDMNAFPVLHSQAVLVVSKKHPLAARTSVSFQELKEERFALISRDFMFADIIARKFAEAAIAPEIVCESPHWDWVYSMVMANQAVTILPLPLVQDFASDKAVFLSLSDPPFPWTLSVIYHKNSILSESMKTFIQLCQQKAEDL